MMQLSAKFNEILGRLGAGRDLALALGVTAIIAMLILPLPAWLPHFPVSLLQIPHYLLSVYP